MSPFSQIRNRISQVFGLTERANWNDEVRSAVEGLAEERRWTLEETALRCRQDSSVLLDLAGRLTVGETHFFRHPVHFEEIAKLVQTRLANFSRGAALWSAGCASGEEPYSIAMAIESQLGEPGIRRISITGTDINTGALQKARRAYYSAWSFRGTAPWVISRYFEGDSSRGSHLRDPAVRGSVSFELQGIEQRAAGFPAKSLDVIMFRNVAIYLRADTLARIYAAFRRILTDDGLLFLGPSDPRPTPDLFQPDKAENTILRPTTADVEKHRRFSYPSPKPAPRRQVSELGPTDARSRPSRPKQSHQSKHPPPRAMAIPNVPPVPGATLAEAARKLGDRGELEQALSIANTLIDAEPGSAAAYLLRGQLLLGASRLEGATQDLRRATFLGPDQPLTRYWYATALHGGGSHRATVAQLQETKRLLEDRSPNSLLEDGETPVSELLGAVMLMLETLV